MVTAAEDNGGARKSRGIASYFQKLLPKKPRVAKKHFLKANEALILDTFNYKSAQAIPTIAISTKLTPNQVRQGIKGLAARNLVASSAKNHDCHLTKDGMKAAKKLHRNSDDVIVVDQF